MEDEIRQLRDIVTQVNSRLDALESKQDLSTIQMPPPPVSVPAPPEPEAITPVAEVTPAPADIISPPEEIPAVVEEKRPRAKEREWEQILGGNWLARIGVLALVIGIGFFLKYAFDNNWIGPAARVILGVIAGLVMLGLGYFWRKRYPIMTRVLSGGGIAVLYLAIFASFATYHLISIYIAIVLLLIISIASTVLALRYDSMALAILGILGAFFAPYILGAFSDGGTGEGSKGQAIQLLTYLIVVDIGVLLLSTFRNWRWFTLLALACSLITYGIWYDEFSRWVRIAVAEIGITAIFLSFVGATYLFHIIRRRIPGVFDYILMLGTAGAYAGISLGLMWHEFRAWMGGFILLLAIFYGLLSYLAYKRNPENNRLSAFSLAIAMIFLTVAIPAQFRDHATTTIAWAAEGAALMWLAFREKIKIFRYESYIAFLLVAIRLLGFDSWTGAKTLLPIFNERFLAFIVSIALIWLAVFLLWKNRKEEGEGADYLVFMAAADFFTLWIIGVEVFAYTRQVITPSDSLSLLILLILAAALILNHLVWHRKPSTIDIVLTVFNTAALIIISVFLWDDLRTWMGAIYFLIAILYGVLAYYALKKKADYKRLGSFALVIAFVFLTVAIPVQFRDHATTTIVWAAEMVALAWLSFILKIPLMRYCSYAVFITMTWRMLIFDTTVEISTYKPILNERFLAFITGIAASYLTVYVLWRRRDTTREWSIVAPFLLIATSFLTLWIISFEAWQSFTNPMKTAMAAAREGLKNAQNLSLTAVWAVYAVAGLIIGIWKHWRYVRIGSLTLLAVPIVKVFVYDVFNLETSYRIGAFVGLGILLLASAYLYQRYSKIIKGVFTNK
jgi:uncharacterized membrane protein